MAFNLFLYSQRDMAAVHHQHGSRLWADPTDHIFFRSQLQTMSNRPSVEHEKGDQDLRGKHRKGSRSEKKANPGAKAAIGHRGALQMLTKMPIEILYEIFGYLHPMDVLNLSRTTRRLRAILLARHARGVWCSALGSVRALPPCPPDMTEPQYASLAFDEWCQSCLAPNVEKISWLCRLRYCRACIKKNFISEAELEHWIPGNLSVEKLDTIFPLIFLEDSRRDVDTDTTPLYFIPAARRYVKELEKISITRDEDALDKWSLEKKELQFKRLRHAALCEFWNVHFAFRRLLRPPPSRLSEVAWIVVLVLILAYLWKK